MILRWRVRRGAKWLDVHCPGWYNGPGAWKVTGRPTDSIKLDLLDLASGSMCVLGQLGGARGDLSFTYMCTEAERNSDDFKTARLGFNIESTLLEPFEDIIYRKLTRHWKREISKRRSAQTRILEDAERAKEHA